MQLTSDQRKKLVEFRKENFIYCSQAKLVLSRIEDLHTRGTGDDEASCMLVVGKSRSGKSWPIKHYMKSHPVMRKPDRDVRPIVYVQVLPDATVKGVAQAMLSELGDLAPQSGSAQSMTQRILDWLQKLRTELVVLDEFQELVEEKSEKIAYKTANWIKILLNSGVCPFVLVGTERAEAVFEANEQLLSRCHSITRLEPFGIDTPGKRESFSNLLQSFEEKLPLEGSSNLTDPELAYRIHQATGGLIGLIAKLLQEACALAMKRGQSSLDMKLLEKAWDAPALSRERKNNPFRGPLRLGPGAESNRD